MGRERSATRIPPGSARAALMHVQWCVRGVARPSPGWLHGLFSSAGLICGWWWNTPHGFLPVDGIAERLDALQLDLHQNWFDQPDPRFGPALVRESTPFVSLSAGVVSREIRYRANVVHRAQFIASDFATDYGQTRGVLIYCWVVTSTVPAVSIEAVAEELRDLNSARPYSAFQLEGEVAAKIRVPARQLYAYQWVERHGLGYRVDPAQFNPTFAAPTPLSDIRAFL
jgi:hypothetical protein